MLKIKTNDGPDSTQIRRINVSDVWGEDELSYAKLIAAASNFASIQDGDNTKAKVTYLDGDGDKITISSDAEFTDSFRQTIKPRKPFRVTILFFPVVNGAKAPPVIVTAKNPKRLIRIERQIARKSNELEALKVKAKLASARPDVARGEQKPMGWMNAEKFDSSFFIHARHTCDGCSKTPIIGTRYRATHIPDFDLCSNCYEKYEGEKTDFKPEALGMYMCNLAIYCIASHLQSANSYHLCISTSSDRDRDMQQRWLRKHLSNANVCMHSSPPCEGFRRSRNAEVERESGEQNPIEAAIGFLKTLNPAIAQSLKDVEIHVSPPLDSVNASQPCQGFSSAAKPKQEDVKMCHVSSPCQGVSSAAKPKSEGQAPKEGTPAVACKPDDEEESIKTEHNSGASDSKDDSFFSDADGNSIAEVIGKTLDVCVQAMEDALIDEAVQKSSKDVADAAAAATVDAFSVASSIADALKNSSELNSVNASSQTDDVITAKDGKDDGLKTEEHSTTGDDWSVVTDENETAETKKEDEEMKKEESDKSITSVEPISAVVLAKWDTELKQLHELGFLDDRINTNALEQLEASHLGCGSDEAVTVTAAVEHILKN